MWCFKYRAFNLQPLIYVVFTLNLVVQSVEIVVGKVSLTFEGLKYSRWWGFVSDWLSRAVVSRLHVEPA